MVIPKSSHFRHNTELSMHWWLCNIFFNFITEFQNAVSIHRTQVFLNLIHDTCSSILSLLGLFVLLMHSASIVISQDRTLWPLPIWVFPFLSLLVVWVYICRRYQHLDECWCCCQFLDISIIAVWIIWWCWSWDLWMEITASRLMLE